MKMIVNTKVPYSARILYYWRDYAVVRINGYKKYIHTNNLTKMGNYYAEASD